MKLDGRVALVTGAGRRVGRAVALALATAGASVAVHYNTSAAGANDTVKQIAARGGKATGFGADFRDEAALNALVPSVVGSMGRLDVLVNSASIFRDFRLFETTNHEWDENFAINVRAPFVLSREMAKSLGGRPGKIINLNDWQTNRPKRFAYGVSKAALTGLTKTLASALAPNVQVNEVALGAILLPPGAPPEYEAVLTAKIPAGRMGRPDEIADAVLWLIGNDYVTGETIRVDGGQHVSRGS